MTTEPILFFGDKPTGKWLDTDHLEHMTDRSVEQGGHLCPKPVALVVEIAGALTDRGALLVDIFAGSGTTLIAAEQTGRRCHAMEIEPAYCDVIVRRWERVSGRQAHKENA